VKVFDGTTQVAKATPTAAGAWTSTPTAALANGSHNLTRQRLMRPGPARPPPRLRGNDRHHCTNAPVETGASIVSGTTKVQLTGTAEAKQHAHVF